MVTPTCAWELMSFSYLKIDYLESLTELWGWRCVSCTGNEKMTQFSYTFSTEAELLKLKKVKLQRLYLKQKSLHGSETQ